MPASHSAGSATVILAPPTILSPSKILERLGERARPHRDRGLLPTGAQGRDAHAGLPQGDCGLGELVLAGHRPRPVSAAPMSRGSASPVAAAHARPATAMSAPQVRSAASSPKSLLRKRGVADDGRNAAAAAVKATAPKSTSPARRALFAEDATNEARELGEQLRLLGMKYAASEAALHQARQHQQRLAQQVKRLQQQNDTLEQKLAASPPTAAAANAGGTGETLLNEDRGGDWEGELAEQSINRDEQSVDAGSESAAPLQRLTLDDVGASEDAMEAAAQQLQHERAIVRRALGFHEGQRFVMAVNLRAFGSLRTLLVDACRVVVELREAAPLTQASNPLSTAAVTTALTARRASSAAVAARRASAAAQAPEVSALRRSIEQLETETQQLQLAADSTSAKLRQVASSFELLVEQVCFALPLLLRGVMGVKEALLGTAGSRGGKIPEQVPAAPPHHALVQQLSCHLGTMTDTTYQFSANALLVLQRAAAVLPPNAHHKEPTAAAEQRIASVMRRAEEARQKPLGDVKSEAMLLAIYSEEVQAYRSRVQEALGSDRTDVSVQTQVPSTTVATASSGRNGGDAVDSLDLTTSASENLELQPTAGDRFHDGSLAARQKLPERQPSTVLPEVFQHLVTAVNVTCAVHTEMLFGKLAPNAVFEPSGLADPASCAASMHDTRRQRIMSQDVPELPSVLSEDAVAALRASPEDALMLIEIALMWRRAVPFLRVKHCASFIDLVRRSPPLAHHYLHHDRRFRSLAVDASSAPNAQRFLQVLRAVIESEAPPQSRARRMPGDGGVPLPAMDRECARRLLRLLRDLAALHHERARINWKGLLRLQKLLRLRSVVLASVQCPEQVDAVCQAFHATALGQQRQEWSASRGTLRLTIEAVWDDLLAALRAAHADALQCGIDPDVFEALGPSTATALRRAAASLAEMPRETLTSGAILRSRVEPAPDRRAYLITAAMRSGGSNGGAAAGGAARRSPHTSPSREATRDY